MVTVAQALGGNMRIDLRGPEAAVTEQFLHSTDIGAGVK